MNPLARDCRSGWSEGGMELGEGGPSIPRADGKPGPECCLDSGFLLDGFHLYSGFRERGYEGSESFTKLLKLVEGEWDLDVVT